LSVARVGVEPTDYHQGLSLAALPVCVPCLLSPSRPASLAGFEPAVSTVTRWRGLRTPLQGRFIPVGARGIEPRYSCSQGTRITGFLDAVQFGEKGSNLHYLGQSQAAYRLADPRVYRHYVVTKVRGEGVEPSRAVSRTASLPLADPRSCLVQLQGWESNPQPSG
jgi:hypothetical protein